jgi:hypothetical protein
MHPMHQLPKCCIVQGFIIRAWLGFVVVSKLVVPALL